MKQHYKRYMYTYYLLAIGFLCGIMPLAAQDSIPSPLSRIQGRFSNTELGIVLVLDLQQEKLVVPNYEFLGEVSGYMYGMKNQNLYGYWFVTSAEYLSNDSSKIALKLMSDSAADPQHIKLSFKNDSIVECKLERSMEMRRQVGNTRKLEKISSAFDLVRE